MVETKTRKTQPHSKMTQGSFDMMNEWIESGGAKAAGFTSDKRSKGHSRIVSEALREFILKHKKKRFDHFNFKDNSIMLTDTDLPQYQDLVEIYINPKGLLCSLHKTNNCIHIEECWKDLTIKKRLVTENIKPLV